MVWKHPNDENRGGMIRCKYRCQSVCKYKLRFEDEGSVYYEAEFYAQSEGDKYRGSSLRIGPMKELPLEECPFEVGKEYYLDISERVE